MSVSLTSPAVSSAPPARVSGAASSPAFFHPYGNVRTHSGQTPSALALSASEGGREEKKKKRLEESPNFRHHS